MVDGARWLVSMEKLERKAKGKEILSLSVIAPDGEYFMCS